MEFDITKLDKRLLIQALFAHSSPIGLGQEEYNQRKNLGEIVDGLPDEECDFLLSIFNNSNRLSEGFSILDYHKGKPMKIDFYRNKNGRVLVDSDDYDYRNGKYCFLKAMLYTFTMDEIKITKKGYGHFVMTDLPDNLILPLEKERVFKSLLKNTIRKENEFGKYWAFNESKAKYIPPFMMI